jgi:hypothetical protein
MNPSCQEDQTINLQAWVTAAFRARERKFASAQNLQNIPEILRGPHKESAKAAAITVRHNQSADRP